MRSIFRVVAAALSLGACTTYESAYEKSVYDAEPIYCYQSLGGTDCYRTANRRDDRRLVNYYGPAPSKYAAPDVPEVPDPQAPPKAERAAGDPAPVPVAASAPTAPPDPAAAPPSTWRTWLPLVSVAFGALQVVAAFVL